jgi:hypothetical protein
MGGHRGGASALVGSRAGRGRDGLRDRLDHQSIRPAKVREGDRHATDHRGGCRYSVSGALDEAPALADGRGTVVSNTLTGQ